MVILDIFPNSPKFDIRPEFPSIKVNIWNDKTGEYERTNLQTRSGGWEGAVTSHGWARYYIQEVNGVWK